MFHIPNIKAGLRSERSDYMLYYFVFTLNVCSVYKETQYCIHIDAS